MNFDEIISNRRSARLFTSKNVSNKQIKKILKSDYNLTKKLS